MSAEQIQAQVVRMADLAWAAGVLDANGNFVMIPRGSTQPGLFMPRITYKARAHARPITDRLAVILGGHAAFLKGGQGQRVWTLSGAKACLEADELLLPYLHVRARRVQLHAELCRAIREFKPASFEDRTVPAEERRRRYELFAAMSGL
jgi:hypothetical protein